MDEDFKLTLDEKRSALWQRLLPYLENELQSLRESNDFAREELETYAIRGRIKQLKILINIGEEADID